MDQHDVAAVLEEIGVLLELKGENPFKTRAYGNAARLLENLEEPLPQLVEQERLHELKGIGDALQQKIAELVTTGRLEYHEKLKASIPPGLIAMLDLPGLGPKKIRALQDQLGIESVEALEQACQRDQVAALKGFGAKSQSKILEGIERHRTYANQHRLDQALAVAEPLLDDLRTHPDVTRCSLAGSLRRAKEVIGDIDFVVSSKAPEAVIGDFVQAPAVKTILAQGETKASVILDNGIQADLRVVEDAEFASALAYFTGSKEHNIVMRQRAIARGLRLNEYGLFRSKEETRDPKLRLACPTEEALYQELDLSFVPPELREDRGEFDAAEAGPSPRLVEWTDLKGSLHNHSNWSDGRGTLDEIADHMQELGLAYWAITDHSKSSFQANGLDEKRLRKQIQAVAEVNQRLADDGSDFRLLTGSEVDIHADGTLDFPDNLLAELDVVVASIHQGFTNDQAKQTRRLIAAAQNPHVHMLGHLTGRLLLEREGYPVDIRAVIDACAETDTWIELNASPYRLDMDWRHWTHARSKGVKCVINCDAHRFEQAGHLNLGARVARKGGLTRDDVINTLPLKKLQQALQRQGVQSP